MLHLQGLQRAARDLHGQRGAVDAVDFHVVAFNAQTCEARAGLVSLAALIALTDLALTLATRRSMAWQHMGELCSAVGCVVVRR